MHQLNEVEEVEDYLSGKPIRFPPQADNISRYRNLDLHISRSGSKNMTARQKSTCSNWNPVRLHTCIHTPRRNICQSSISVYEP